MDNQTAENVLQASSILLECYRSNVEDDPWVQANPEIAILAERAVSAMEDACDAIRQMQSHNCRRADSEQHMHG